MVTIRGLYTAGQEDADSSRITVPGNYREIGGDGYLTFTLTGPDDPAGGPEEAGGDKYLVKIRREPEQVNVVCRGSKSCEMIFEQEKTHEAILRTAWGALRLDVMTKDLRILEARDFPGGENWENTVIRARYSLYSEGSLITENRIHIMISEETGADKADRTDDKINDRTDDGTDDRIENRIVNIKESRREEKPENRREKRMESRRDLPVGVFDSGVGGVSVLRELIKIMPEEDFYYFGDSANAPYGTKSRETIRDLTMGHVSDMIRRGIKAVVVACNTATSAAITDLRSAWPGLPVIGIEPALKPAVMVSEHPRVLVLATPGTVNGEKFRHLMQGFEDRAVVSALACPGLMEFVEKGRINSPDLYDYLEKLFAPYREDPPDAVVLGCTHYPFIKTPIRRVLGESVHVLDGSEGTARETRRRLAAASLLREREERGKVTFEMSIPEKEKLCRMLLDCPL